jgi:hypothetical protein
LAGGAQALPQAPQWATVARVSVSQPLALIASQSPKPALQASSQRPAAHVPEALGLAAQAIPQAPQCAAAVMVLVSQPLAGSPSQSPKPGLQPPTTQDPARQAPAAFGGLHARPQAPQ